MVRPAHFNANPETAPSNVFQRRGEPATAVSGTAALLEFDRVTDALAQAGITVVQLPGQAAQALPDEVFPNNWFSSHDDGTLVLYPMESALRRRERRLDLAVTLQDQGFTIQRCHDLTHYEQQHRFLEGTGSLVLDHPGRRVFACRSTRTDGELVEKWASLMGFEASVFDAEFGGRPVYHTNVLLSLGTKFAVLAADPIAEAPRRSLVAELAEGGRELIRISNEQMANFAANILELNGGQGPVLVLSERAYGAFERQQRDRLARYARLLPISIPTIETLGGGSLRCMLGEIRLPAGGLVTSSC